MREIVYNVSSTLSNNPVSAAAAAMIVGSVMLIAVGGIYITRNTILATALFAVLGNFGALTGTAYMASPVTPFGLNLYHAVPVAAWGVFISLIVLGFVVLCCSNYELTDSEAAENTPTSRDVSNAQAAGPWRPQYWTLGHSKAAAYDTGLPSVHQFGRLAAAMDRRRLVTTGSH